MERWAGNKAKAAGRAREARLACLVLCALVAAAPRTVQSLQPAEGPATDRGGITSALEQARGMLSGHGIVPAGDALSPCATPLLNQVQARRQNLSPAERAALSTLLNRPAHLTETRETEHFRFHFAPEGPDAPHGWPWSQEYIGTAMSACERAYEVHHSEELKDGVPIGQGWPKPADDGDGWIDVYIMDLGWGVFGYALHEPVGAEPETTGRQGCPGYMVVDNDFAGFGTEKPGDALRTTIAHEYHHLVQFGYGYDSEASWFMEQCATMEEAEAYALIRDLHAFLPIYGTQTHRRLDLYNGSFEYGSWLWPRFLVDRELQAGASREEAWRLLRTAWETWSREGISMRAALDHVLQLAGSSLQKAHANWTAWNAFTGDRDDGQHYVDGHLYPRVVVPALVLDQFPAEGVHPHFTRQPEGLGASYVELRPAATSADDLLEIRIDACEDLHSATLIVWRAPGRAEEPRFIPSWELDVTLSVVGWQDVERAWLILVNGQDAPRACDFAIHATTSFTHTGVDPIEDDLTKLQLRCAPNPFEPHTVISFQLPWAMETALRIYDGEGRHVRTLIDGRSSAGPHAVYWDGRNRAGLREPAGVYYGRIETKRGSQRLRMVRIR